MAVINISWISFCVDVCFHFLEKYVEVELLGHMVKMFNFIRNFHVVFKRLYANFAFTTMSETSSSTSSLALGIVKFCYCCCFIFIFAILLDAQMYVSN